MQKKIFILITTLGTGGAERVVSLLIQEWKDKYDITLVLFTELIEYELPPNIRVISLNQPFMANGFYTTFKIPFLAFKFYKLCKKYQADISISFLKRPNYINCLGKLIGSKTKVIISERSHFSESLKSLSGLEKRMSIFLTKKLYPHADLIITNSKVMRSDLENNFKIQAKYKVINNPINLSLIEKLSAQEVIFDDDNAFKFINVGAFRKEKNQAILIDAFYKIKHLNVKLYFLGHRFLKQTLIEKIKEMQLESQVFFLDFDTNPFKYFSKSDCFILSSDFEGFPNTLLEALACGLPVISTDCLSGPREILAPETDPQHQIKDHIEITDFGILVPVNNAKYLSQAMEKIVEDKDLYQRLKIDSKKRAADFDVSKIMLQFENAIENQF